MSRRNSICVVGSTPHSPQALEQIAASQADILLLDSSATKDPCPRFILQVHRAVPEARVVVIGLDADEETFFSLVSAGAVGCLLKDASAADLVNAIHAISRNEAVCPPRFSLSLFKRFAAWFTESAASPNAKLHAGLSRREQQLVPFLERGLSNKEIASHMNLSEQTVKNHIHRMLGKLGVTNRQEIVDSCCSRSSSIEA